MTGPSPIEAAVAQFAVIAGRDVHHRLELRWRRPQGGMGQHFRPADRLRPLAEMAVEIGGRTDLYVGACPRAKPYGGRKRAVDRAWCLWVDCDTAIAAERLRGFSPAPTMIVASGRDHGLHGWWSLREPLPAPRVLERALRRIAHHLAGDLACCDSARIMRVAGTFNHKHGEPRPVTVERLELDTFDAAEIVGGLPDAPRPAGRDASRAAVATGDRSPRTSDDPLLQIPPPTYVEALTGREVGRDGKVACPFHEDRTPSLHVYPDPERGWTCFGACQAGGTIIDFGARLYGLEPRGDGYREIRERLERDLRRRAA